MIRLIFLGIIAIIAFVIWVSKQAAAAATGSERLRQESFRTQTQKTMHATARGVNWLNDQWEQATRSSQTKPDGRPYLAIVISVAEGDRGGLLRATSFFEDYGSQINRLTRVDTIVPSGTGVWLARMCIDISNASRSTIRQMTQELTRCAYELEDAGQAAFVVSHVGGEDEVLAQNNLV
ncbi:MAG: hypothetical protein KF684_05050 [Phycisphaeraceae bacterium]|nr:hypothetical protein [Phycisphaeraceae bacterium]